MQAADLRETLLDQLAYLIEEAEAVKVVVDCVPEALLEARPLPQDLSVKEMYGLLATLDEVIYLPRFQQIIIEDVPTFDGVDEPSLATEAGWNDQPISAILYRVQEARRQLLAFLCAQPPRSWTRRGRFGDAPHDLYTFAHHITQHDVDVLRTIGYRLHESHFFRRAGKSESR